MLSSSTPMLPQVERVADLRIRWFSGGGAVVERASWIEVTVRGVLIGRYAVGDLGGRNALLVGLAASPTIHLEQLAAAFEISSERLRQIRRRAEREGLAAVVAEPKLSRSKIDAATGAWLAKQFEKGVPVMEAHRRIQRRVQVSESTVRAAKAAWEARRAQALAAETAQPQVEVTSEPAHDRQLALPLPPAVEEPVTVEGAEAPPPLVPVRRLEDGLVQHAGTWLLSSMLARHGLFDEADAIAGRAGLRREAVRVAVEAFASALAIGEPSVEGVRRLATPSGALLVGAATVPSPDRVRRTLDTVARAGGEQLHKAMSQRLLEMAAAPVPERPTVFYIDNHLRPYTGQAVVRRGWRMQDKRVRPGTTDLYVHDEDGRPVMRFESASHESLTSWLPRVAGWLRAALGEERRLLFAFDRAGAFPETLAALREERIELVTYERKPYRQLPPRDFLHEMTVGDPAKPATVETIRYREQVISLGRGRGHAQRVALRMPNGRQVNLLALSRESAPRLAAIMSGRWVQENAFKHGVERWGINHLDGRRTSPVPPTTIVPNPARRRLDDALRLASVRMGLARNRVAELPDGHAKRAAAEAEIVACLAERQQLLDERGHTPKHAPLATTELAGKLVAHNPLYKSTLDVVRIVCANAEAELARLLAPHMSKPREAKRLLAAVFTAPALVRCRDDQVRVTLALAANRAEQKALGPFFDAVNALGLSLPGDPAARPLRFDPKS